MIEGESTREAIKDLGIKMVTKREQRLVQIKEKCEEDLLTGEIEKLISKKIIELMEQEIRKEKKTLNT